MEKIEITKDALAKMLDDVSTAAATKAVEEKVKELGLGAKKFSAFGKTSLSDKSAEEVSKMESKAKMASFITALYKKDMDTLAMFKAAMNETTDADGGFVVPTEFAAEVNRVVEDFGLVAKLARKFPMKSDTLKVPRLSATVSMTYAGENTNGTPSQPVFESVILSAKSLIGLTPMSNELLADANVAVVDLLIELFAEAISGMLDSQGLAGTGSPFTGILADTGVNKVIAGNAANSGKDTITEAATPDYCRDMIAAVKPWSLQGAAFIMNSTIWSLIQQYKVAGAYAISAVNPVVTGASQVQGFPTANAGTLWGYPVYLSDKMPALSDSAADKKFVIFGNLKHLYVGQRAGMSVDISNSATVGGNDLFAANMSAVRVVARHAVAVGLPKAFACLATSTI